MGRRLLPATPGTVGFRPIFRPLKMACLQGKPIAGRRFLYRLGRALGCLALWVAEEPLPRGGMKRRPIP